MGQATINGKTKQPTKADLQRQLSEALARAESAELALLGQPTKATPPPGGNRAESWFAPAVGVMRLWLMTDMEGYRLKLVHFGPDGVGWEMIKWTDGTRYHLFEPCGGEIVCDCPGCAAHGPQCNGGKGCKHARLIKAARQLLDPGL